MSRHERLEQEVSGHGYGVCLEGLSALWAELLPGLKQQMEEGEKASSSLAKKAWGVVPCLRQPWNTAEAAGSCQNVLAPLPSMMAWGRGVSPSSGVLHTGLTNSFHVSSLQMWGERGAGGAALGRLMGVEVIPSQPPLSEPCRCRAGTRHGPGPTALPHRMVWHPGTVQATGSHNSHYTYAQYLLEVSIIKTFDY